MVHGKLPPGKLPHGRLPPTLTLTQTVILIQGEICWGGGAIFRGAISGHERQSDNEIWTVNRI